MLLCLHVVLHNTLQRWSFFSAARLLYLLYTVARRLLTMWLHTALWWSAWRGVTCYSSLSVLWCCPNTRGTAFPNNGGWSRPWTCRACRRVLMPLWALQLWISPAEYRKAAHAQRLLITCSHSKSTNRLKQYRIRSVHLGTNIWVTYSTCEQGGGDDIAIQTRYYKSKKNEVTRK